MDAVFDAVKDVCGGARDRGRPPANAALSRTGSPRRSAGVPPHRVDGEAVFHRLPPFEAQGAAAVVVGEQRDDGPREFLRTAVHQEASAVAQDLHEAAAVVCHDGSEGRQRLEVHDSEPLVPVGGDRKVEVVEHVGDEAARYAGPAGNAAAGARGDPVVERRGILVPADDRHREIRERLQHPRGRVHQLFLVLPQRPDHPDDGETPSRKYLRGRSLSAFAASSTAGSRIPMGRTVRIRPIPGFVRAKAAPV